MTFEAIISTSILITSLAIKGVGSPSQIKLLLKSKNSNNHSLIQWILMFSNYVLWTIHGIILKDWTIIIAQGIGIFTSGTILYLVIRYRHKETT